MSSYPPSSTSQNGDPSSTGGSPNIFGSSQPVQPNPEDGLRQLVTVVASNVSSLKELAAAYPGMSQACDMAIEALKQGITQEVSQMQTMGSEGGNPSYA